MCGSIARCVKAAFSSSMLLSEKQIGCVEQPGFFAALRALMAEKPSSRSTSAAASMICSFEAFLTVGISIIST